MDDKELIRLFQERDERAAAECERQYAPFCRRIAANLLDRPEDVEEEVEAAELSRLIDGWLRAQKTDERVLFVRRYYFGESLKALAAAYGCGEARMAQIMLRLRRSLKKAIEEWRD